MGNSAIHKSASCKLHYLLFIILSNLVKNVCAFRELVMEDKNSLPMYGGIWGGLVPLAILVIGLIALSIAERGGTKPFWACAWLALSIGLFLARDKKRYCESAMHGIGDKNGIVIVTAWLFAGVFGKLMAAGGLVQGLLWMGMSTGASEATFTFLVFLAAMTFSLGTGTSTGTCIALTPVLYPAGVYLGSDPALLGTAILSGAAFGDNLAPISDTTIVSAYTQGAEMKDVVRSRAPLSLTAAAIAGVIFLLFGGGGEIRVAPQMEATLDPSGIFMLIALVVVVVAALCGRHIIEALIPSWEPALNGPQISYMATKCGQCSGTCKGGCHGKCKTGCLGTCKSSCRTSCKGSCRASCKGSCSSTCKGSCRGTRK